MLFRSGFTASLDLPYEEIDDVRTCSVGPFIPFMPTGVKVTMKNGKSYKLSVLGRKKIAEYIQSKLS